MKRAFRYAVVFTLALPILLACNLSATQPTPIKLIPHTDVPAPTAEPTNPFGPTLTYTPEPTFTPEVLFTPTTLPDELNKIFSGVSVTHRDGFDSAAEALPPGWICSEPLAAWVTKDGEFQIKSANPQNGTGVSVYFAKEPITRNTGVYFSFQFTGMLQNFSFGMNAVSSNGGITNKAGQKEFYSVSMEMQEKKVVAHSALRSSSTKSPFRGDLKLQEGVWYNIAMGLDGDKNFIIKLWSQADPRKQLRYTYKSKEFPASFYFISWVSAKRSLLIDNFTFFKFDEILEK